MTSCSLWAPSRSISAVNRSVSFWSGVELAMALVGAEVAVPLFALEEVGALATQVADLDPGLLHALVDEADDVAASLLGQGRDVQAHHGTVDVRDEPDVTLLDGFFDRPEDAPGPTAG